MSELAVCIQGANENVTPKETIDAIYKAGFKNVFVQYYHRDNIDYDELELIDYCRQLGLNIIFCHLGYKYINEIWLEGPKGDKVTENYMKDLDVMQEKRINMVVMHLTSHKEAPLYNKIGLERLKKIVQHAKELNIKIAFENTRKQGFLEYVLGNIKDESAGICFDAGHYHTYFDDQFDFEFFKNRYYAIHLHDNDKSSDQHLLPFDGNVDWQSVLAMIKKNNYNGPITLELCYRYQYLNESLEDFYKEGFKRGERLQELYNQC